MQTRKKTKRRVLKPDDITALVREFGCVDGKVDLRATMWINQGKDSARWSGKCECTPKAMGQILVAFFSLFPQSTIGSTPKLPFDPAEMFRVRRETLEKAEAAYREDVIQWKGRYRAPFVTAAQFCSGWWLDICGADMRVMKTAIVEILQEGKIPSKRIVPLTSARWGLDRRWARKNIHALAKKYGMDLRAHTTKGGVVIERVG